MCSYIRECHNDWGRFSWGLMPVTPTCQNRVLHTFKGEIKTRVWDPFSSWGANHDLTQKEVIGKGQWKQHMAKEQRLHLKNYYPSTETGSKCAIPVMISGRHDRYGALGHLIKALLNWASFRAGGPYWKDGVLETASHWALSDSRDLQLEQPNREIV